MSSPVMHAESLTFVALSLSGVSLRTQLFNIVLVFHNLRGCCVSSQSIWTAHFHGSELIATVLKSLVVI